MQNNYREWVINWFSQQGEIPGNTDEEKSRINYFEEGLIDSMAVISLITEIEEHYDIRFNEQHFRDRRFSTIGGIADIIEDIKQSNG